MAAGPLYPAIMLAAVLTGALALRATQQGLGLAPQYRFAIGISAFCGAMLGAKLPFLLWDWQGVRDGTAGFSSGKTIMCGMVGAYFAVELAKWILEVRTKTGDTFVVPVALSVAIGRLGCLYAGCCYGETSTLPGAMQCAIVDDALRHPTQLYETLFHLGMAAVCGCLIRRGIWKGQVLKFYIISYLVYRFVTEWIRPEAHYWLGLTAYQWFSLVLIPVFSFLWWRDASAVKHLMSPQGAAPHQASPSPLADRTSAVHVESSRLADDALRE